LIVVNHGAKEADGVLLPCLRKQVAIAVKDYSAGGQGLTLVHILAQIEPFLSLKPAKHPSHGTNSAHVELRGGRV
jgi:hypothetical protein